MEVVLLNLLRVFGICFHGFWPFGVLVVVYFGGVRFVSVLLSVVLGWVWD